MSEYKPELRAGIDWDGDGFIHFRGVASDAVPNLINNPIYPSLWCKGYRSDWIKTNTLTALDNDDNGLQNISVLMGKNLADDEARFINMFLKDDKPVLPNYPLSRFDGYAFSDVSYLEDTGSPVQEQEATEYGFEQVVQEYTGTASQRVFRYFLGQSGNTDPTLATIDEIAVVSGTEYTFHMWFKYEVTGDDVAQTLGLDAIVYDSAGAELVQRLNFLKTNNTSPSLISTYKDEWQLVAWDWTPSYTGFVSIKIFADYVIHTSGSETGKLSHTGWSLAPTVDWEHDYTPDYIQITSDPIQYSNWVSSQAYFYGKTYSTGDFDNVLTANTSYKVGFFISSDVDKTITHTVRSCENGTTNTSDVTDTVAVTSTKQFISIDIPMFASNNYSCVLQLYDTTFSDLTLTVSGVVIHPDTQGYLQIVDSISQYDNLQNLLLAADWQLGKKKYYDTLASEGTLTLEVDNRSALFSPANVNSPLFGKLLQNLKVVIQMRASTADEWITMWSGWTDGFDSQIGTQSARRAYIRCNQGIFRLREGEFSYPPTDDVRMDEVIQTLVDFSGWRSIASPLAFYLTLGNKLGEDTYLPTTSDIWARVDTGKHIYELVGDGWNNKTKIEKAIKDMLSAEDATLWVNREGKLELLNRDAFMHFGASDATLDLDTFIKGNYAFGEDLINTVEVFVTPKEEIEEATVWRTKVPIRVEKKSESQPILLTFEFEEGSSRTVDNLKLAQGDMVVTVWAIAKKRRKKRRGDGVEPMPVTDEKVLDKIKIRNTTDGSGKTWLTITNDNKKAYHVEIEVIGDYIEGGEGVSYFYDDKVAIGVYKALHKKEIKSKIATTQQQAKGLAELRLIRDAYPSGEFTWIEVLSSNVEQTQQILDITLGSILVLSESYSGESDKVHVIVGEKATVINGLVRMRFDLVRLPDFTFMRFGDNLSPSSIIGV